MRALLLVTGTAGFIGFHTAIRLLERGERVIGLDNVNDYYDVRLKKARLKSRPPKLRPKKPRKTRRAEQGAWRVRSCVRTERAGFVKH